jgi:hypothetical protein
MKCCSFCVREFQYDYEMLKLEMPSYMGGCMLAHFCSISCLYGYCSAKMKSHEARILTALP